MNKDKIDLTVEHNGKGVVLNKDLLYSQNAWPNVYKIKATHTAKLKIFEKMEESNDPTVLKHYDKVLETLEFELQKLWGFELNVNYHRFWERPKCKCPEMDNEERYPTGYYIRSAGCPLHGWEVEGE